MQSRIYSLFFRQGKSVTERSKKNKTLVKCVVKRSSLLSLLNFVSNGTLNLNFSVFNSYQVLSYTLHQQASTPYQSQTSSIEYKHKIHFVSRCYSYKDSTRKISTFSWQRVHKHIYAVKLAVNSTITTKVQLPQIMQKSMIKQMRNLATIYP